MRFMPLIECFLTVCGSTSLRVPQLTETVEDISSSSSLTTKSHTEISPLVKRKASVMEASASGGDTAVGSTCRTEMETSMDGRELDAAAIALAVRALSDTVPGARFRNNVGYLQMQLELDDSAPAAPLLLRFADRNRVLLNMVLKNNVHLLESSFSALVTVPRCRHLLHFDIKRLDLAHFLLSSSSSPSLYNLISSPFLSFYFIY